MLEIFMILCNFKPKKSPFRPFLLEKLIKLVILVAKIIKTLRKFKDQYLFLSAAN